VDPREETANVAGQRKEFQNKTRSEMNWSSLGGRIRLEWISSLLICAHCHPLKSDARTVDSLGSIQSHWTVALVIEKLSYAGLYPLLITLCHGLSIWPPLLLPSVLTRTVYLLATEFIESLPSLLEKESIWPQLCCKFLLQIKCEVPDLGVVVHTCNPNP
jgi:hypothetical protein